MKVILSYQSNLWKLKFIRLLFWMHFFAGILVPFFTQWGGLKLSQIFFLNSWFMLWNFFLEVPTGVVADFWGRKISLALGSLVGMVAALVYVSRPDFGIFLFAEVLFAVAYTLHSGADEALAYDSLKALNREGEAKKILANMESFKLGGILTGTVVGSWLAGRFGFRVPMLTYVLPSLLAFGLAITLKEPPFLTDTQESASRSYGKILKEGRRYFLQNKILLLLTGELVFTHALSWGLIWLFQPLLQKAGLSLAYFGSIHALSCLGQILFLSNVKRVEEWLGSKKKLLSWSTIITGISFLILGFTSYLPVVIVSIMIGFSFSLPRIPIFNSYMNHFIPSDKRATILSFTSMARTFSIVVINPIIGLLADWSLSYTILILGIGLILASSFSRIEERHLEG